MPAPAREIYLLSPKQLSPETIAVAFAKTSRSPESFRDIAAGLTDEKSAQFHEKWVVGYGHASVAEHAVLHLAIENASRLAMEAIESNRLASYTEKSTRYQKWDPEAFHIPAELEEHPLRDEYLATCRMLFETYADSLEPVRQLIERTSPRREGEGEDAWDRRIRSQYVDTCRFLLPASALANVGLTANARVLENAIRKMRSHPLAEVRRIGDEIKMVSQGEVPTLVKYAEPVEYLIETGKEFSNIARQECEKNAGAWCDLIDYTRDGEERVLASALYRFGDMSYSTALSAIRTISQLGDSATGSTQALAEVLLGRLDRHDIPLRELEHASYTFDLVMDQGAYAEFKRHRMMTQTPQLLGANLGYAIPRRISDAGFEGEYRKSMEAAREAYLKLAAWDPLVAQYVVPNGFNRRVLATFNLREAYHFCQLRAAPNAHFSIRRIALRVAEEIRGVHPLLAKFMDLPDETWMQIEKDFFTQTR
jgi:thymidylate synthase ThyX